MSLMVTAAANAGAAGRFPRPVRHAIARAFIS